MKYFDPIGRSFPIGAPIWFGNIGKTEKNMENGVNINGIANRNDIYIGLKVHDNNGTREKLHYELATDQHIKDAYLDSVANPKIDPWGFLHDADTMEASEFYEKYKKPLNLRSRKEDYTGNDWGFILKELIARKTEEFAHLGIWYPPSKKEKKEERNQILDQIVELLKKLKSF